MKKLIALLIAVMFSLGTASVIANDAAAPATSTEVKEAPKAKKAKKKAKKSKKVKKAAEACETPAAEPAK